MDCSHGISVHGHLQARILERVAISSSRGSSPLRDWTWVSCMTIRFLTNWATTGHTQMPTKSSSTRALPFPPWFSEKSTHHHESHAKSWGPSAQAGGEGFRGSAFLTLREVKSLSHVRRFVSPWIVAYQAPLSMGFSRHEHWNRLPFPSGGALSHPGIEPGSPTLQADSTVWATQDGISRLPSITLWKPRWQYHSVLLSNHVLSLSSKAKDCRQNTTSMIPQMEFLWFWNRWWGNAWKWLLSWIKTSAVQVFHKPLGMVPSKEIFALDVQISHPLQKSQTHTRQQHLSRYDVL